ncbi:hypothetical protein RintRC_1033 [Richelia intracellularis]|nr:hypothetical protein RintRC_1033 [Richelia intracellularis]
MNCNNRQKYNRADMDNNYVLIVITAYLFYQNNTSQPPCQ